MKARALGGRIALLEKGLEHRQRLLLLAADREAERKPPPSIVPIAPVERRSIIGLGCRLVAEKVISEPAVGPEAGHAPAELLRSAEVGQRRRGIAARDKRRTHARLRDRTVRIDVRGSTKEAGRSLRIARLESRLSGSNQGVEIARGVR
jgi:hypothetical protein